MNKQKPNILNIAIQSAHLLLLSLCLQINTVNARDLEFGPPLIIQGDLNTPGGIAIDEARNRVLVADTAQHRIRYFDLPITTGNPSWQEFGFVSDRSATDALSGPQGIAVDSSGNVYVVDTFNNQVKLYRYNASSDSYRLDNRFARDTLDRVGGVDIQRPRDIAIGSGDQIYLLDSGNKRILLANGPDARRWTVWHSNNAWNNPYGLDIASDGTVYMADTDNHRVIRIDPTRTENVIGSFGTGSVQFRYPRDIAVADDGRLFIADTHNHRIHILRADGNYYRQLGAGRLFDGIDKLSINSSNHIFAIDRIANQVIAYLGPIEPPPFDAYIRDVVADDGTEPFTSGVQLDSPDILFRYNPDIALSSDSFARYGSDTPIFGEDIYVYARFYNRGRFTFPSSTVRFYNLAATGPYNFPDDWSAANLFSVEGDGSAGVLNNRLAIPPIPASDDSSGTRVDQSVVVGPLLWRVPPNTTETCDGRQRIAARLININDPSQTVDGLEIVRLNNNIAGLNALAVSPSCIPDPDRYEENDSPASSAMVTETWEHLHRRCPRVITRGTRGARYPERICPGVFENYLRPGNARSAEEIWTMVIPNLSLHSRTDRDFFDITLPDPAAAEYGNDDIRSEEDRIRFPDAKEPMPECGAVQRTEFGPAGLDNTIYVTIGTQLTVTIEPTDGSNNTVTARTLNVVGEQLHLYRDTTRVDELWSGSPIQKTIDCPRTSEAGMTTVRISFGEREMERLRALAATGGYQIRLEYITSIDRGAPSWVGELGPDRPRRGLGCRPTPRLPAGSFAGGFSAGMAIPLPSIGNNFFPNCIPGLEDFFVGDFIHPRIPGLPDCIADGPGCFENYLIRFANPQQGLEFFFRSDTPMNIQVLGENREVIAESETISQAIDPQQLNKLPDAKSVYLQRVFIPQINSGTYVLQIKGKPTNYRMEFKPPIIESLNDNLIKDIEFDIPINQQIFNQSLPNQ